MVVGAVLFIGAHRSSRPDSLEARVHSIAAGIRCPTCQGETAADSDVPAARAIRADISGRLQTGESPEQIRAYLVSRYGVGILESPPTRGVSALVWVLPIVVVPAGALALIVGFRRARPRPDFSVTDTDRALVARALSAPERAIPAGVAQHLTDAQVPAGAGSGGLKDPGGLALPGGAEPAGGSGRFGEARPGSRDLA